MALDLRADLYESCLQISPKHPDYAALSIQAGFDWSPLSGCSFDRLYLVVFRSVRLPEADLTLLREHDDRAYAEALKSGGLLHYFKGQANERACASLSASGRRASRPKRLQGPHPTGPPQTSPPRCTCLTCSTATG